MNFITAAIPLLVLFLSFSRFSHSAGTGASIDSIAHFGEGCSDDSLEYNLSDDGNVFALTYKGLTASLKDVAKKECQIQVVLNVPTNQHFRFISTRHRGFVYVLNGAKGKLEASVRFKGQKPGINIVSQFSSPLKKDFRTLDTVPADPLIWSSANCQESKATFTVVTRVSVTAVAPNDKLATGQILPSQESNKLEQSFQLGWESCKSTSTTPATHVVADHPVTAAH